MPTSLNRYALYQQVLKLEFIREFHALVEAANGRGDFKADFTDKILALVGKLIEPVVDAANITLPVVPALLKSGAESLIDSKNEARKEQKTQYFLQKGFDDNANALNVLAEQMSMTALKRYQWFVSQLDQDSVIRFAKTGVERMLEYLARKQLPLSIEYLLDGLLKGHSGAYVSGYFNTQLTPEDYLAERIPPSSRIRGALGFTSVTAEGMYGRSGLMTFDHNSSKLYLHAQFDKIKAKHKILEDEQEQSRFDKVKSSLSKEGRERWFDYGYTRAHAEYQEEPKYGYALVTPAEVNSYYGDQKNITTKPLVKLESKLKNSLTTFSYEIIPFNKTHLKNYLYAKKEIPQLTLLAYIKELFNAQNARLAYFDADDRDLSNLDLSGAHLDECVFDYSIFPADLTNTTLRNSFLRYADLTKVSKAQGLDLSEAHAEYMVAAGANLSNAILRNSYLFRANLARANLAGTDMLGANLVESNLTAVISPTSDLQNLKATQEQLAAQQQQIEEKQSAQSQEIAALRKTVSELQANNHLDVAEKLDQFLQERAAREALERYCHSEIEMLNIQAQQQEKLSQQQAEHLQNLKQDMADLQKLQAASKNDGENLLNQFNQLSTQVDNQGSQLKKIEQLLDKLISGIQNQLNEQDKRLRRHSEEIRAIKHEREEKKPEQPPVLSIERLQQIKQELSASYQKKAVMFEFSPNQTTQVSFPITEKTFVHLALVAQTQQQQKEREIRSELKQNLDTEEKSTPQQTSNEKSQDLERQQLLNSWEMLSQVQEPIGVNDLWLKHKNDQNIPEHVLIEGSAGIGKTTLCGYIAAQWSKQTLWADRFAWVLWIPLRNLIDTSRYPQLANYNYSVKSFVLGECFGCLPNDRRPGLTLNEQDCLWQQLEEQADRVLYVLDGYDEIAGYEKIDKLEHLKAALSQLLQSKHILLTTRPQVINARLLKEQQTRRLVTLGLSDDNIPPYVEHYFKAISSYSEQKKVVEEKHYDTAPLLDALKANQTLWSVSHVPLHLSLICLAYAEGKIQVSDLKQNFSLTQLYQQIVNLLLQRYVKEKLKDTAEIEPERVTADNIEDEKNAQAVIHCLEELAFCGMAQYGLILDDKLLNDSRKAANQPPTIIRDLIASGLLKEINEQGKSAYQFIHLTFQEFFAARCLARRLQQPNKYSQDWIESLHEYKHKPRYAVMLWFTAGLLKSKPTALQHFFQLLQEPPQDEVGLYHLGLVMRCIAEVGYPKELTAQISQHQGQLVEKCWIMIREGTISNNGNQEMKAQIGQQVLQWLGQQRSLTSKIEFPISSLTTILKYLGDQQLKVRKAAARALGELKAPTPEILQGLVALLKDYEDQSYFDNVRSLAAVALGKLKAPTPEILQGLVALLKDENWWVRQAAARALGELKAPTPEILQGLVALLNDIHIKSLYDSLRQPVAEALAQTLGELRAPTPEILQGLVALLKDDGYSVRKSAAEALARTLRKLKVPTPEIFQGLVLLLKDEKWQARDGASRALGELKTPTPEVLQGLVALLKDDSESVRHAAAVALGQLKASTPEILLGLVALLKDNESYVRKSAAWALGELKASTPEILLGLVALLKDNESDVRKSAAWALGELKAPTPEILQGLGALLEDDKYDVIEAATEVLARTLGELKAPTPEILQCLVALKHDHKMRVGEAAAEALYRVLGELKAPTPEILQGLVALLKDDSKWVRLDAARALAQLKVPTPEILQGLLALLKDNEGCFSFSEGTQYVNTVAARALGELKALTPEILQGIVALLKDDSEWVRLDAAQALGELKVPTPDILQGLLALLKDDSQWVRQAAARALGKLKATTPEILQDLVALLKDEKCEARDGAAQALGEMKASSPEILKELVALLKNEKWQAKQGAAWALGELKAPTPEILQGLVALLEDNDIKVREAAAGALAQVLGELKAPISESLQCLVALQKDGKSHATESAVGALGKLKTPTPEILQGLVALLKDDKWQTREGAARALGELKVLTTEILQGLVALLKDDRYSVRKSAGQALGELKAPTPEILQGLGALLKDEQYYVRQAAAEALGEWKAPIPEILQGLVALLKDEQYYVRQAAAEALGELKAPTPEILQGLVALLKDYDRDLRQAAARALGKLKAPTPEILQGLVALLKDNCERVRQAAAEALARVLGELRAPTPVILQYIVPLLKDKYFSIREAAARALGKLKAPTAEILQGLVALLKDEEWETRKIAVQVLGELNKPTPEILQGLVALLTDNDGRFGEPKVSQVATEALMNFSTASILKLYFQTSCQWYQSSLQEWLLNFICQSWLFNRQVVKIANKQVFWLEQGQWQQLDIPSNHPYFQYYVKKTMEELVGSPLSLTFPKVSTAENLRFFSQDRSSSLPSSQSEPTAGHKQRPN